ncbi:MAG: NAD(P)/FAD-dependent oxidoreductase [Hyphomicrobiales bacterium]|nr:NAD(P)/FAD-dependent oxidoreductase [Hyphomicrobiales bacterium]MCP5001505.1 NAD(P)/FAD-dependent oxidoreductase [Hyphomicrobiales bacterium]
MANTEHYVVIGNGVAGSEAARHLRQRDSDSRITMVSAGKLLSINRYELPKIFSSSADWRDFLLHPPEYYDEQKISVRRNTWVSHVDPTNKLLMLHHREPLSYSKLLIASGGGRYIPESLNQFKNLIAKFGTYEEAKSVCDALPRRGHMVMLGGDMIGLDLARSLVRNGYKVTVIGEDHLFWPHRVEAEQRQKFVAVLQDMGICVRTDVAITSIQRGDRNRPDRRIILDNNEVIDADVILSFCGLMPSLAFMAGAGVDIERGVLVNPQLRSTDKNIWAAGDVCQIWSPEENQYRFYYGWKNVKKMGRIAAFNMTGADESIDTVQNEKLVTTKSGEIDSPFWQYG